MWNPRGNTRPWNVPLVTSLGTQPAAPATGIDESQGQLYPDDIQNVLQVPQSMGVNLLGFTNPFNLTFYSFPLSTTVATRVIPPNLRRTYLIIQNQGPGNVYLNFGQDVTLATAVTNSNGMQLIQTQIYEQIGGGDVDPETGISRAYSFVSPNYVSAITDTAGTTLLVGEGVWQFVQAPGHSF